MQIGVVRMPKVFKGYNLAYKGRSGMVFKKGQGYKLPEREDIFSYGFHGSVSALDVFGAYPPSTSVYGTATITGKLVSRPDSLYTLGTIAGTEIRIKDFLSIEELITAAINQMKYRERADLKKWKSSPFGTDPVDYRVLDLEDKILTYSTEDNCHRVPGRILVSKVCKGEAVVRGIRSVAITKKRESVSMATNDNSVAMSEGVLSTAFTVGNNSLAKASGCGGVAVAVHEWPKSVALGGNSLSASSGFAASSEVNGYCSIAVAQGDKSSTVCTKRDSVAISVGFMSTAEAKCGRSVAITVGECSAVRGVRGSILTIVIFENSRHNWTPFTCTGLVDDIKLLSNTWYTVPAKDKMGFRKNEFIPVGKGNAPDVL